MQASAVRSAIVLIRAGLLQGFSAGVELTRRRFVSGYLSEISHDGHKGF